MIHLKCKEILPTFIQSQTLYDKFIIFYNNYYLLQISFDILIFYFFSLKIIDVLKL